MVSTIVDPQSTLIHNRFHHHLSSAEACLIILGEAAALVKFQSDLAIHLVWGGSVWRLLAGLFSRDRPSAGTLFDNFKPFDHILLDRRIIADEQEKQLTGLMALSSPGSSRGAPLSESALSGRTFLLHRLG